ncbi:MAG: nucleotidyl transferase AbiEii/AbiGii toxin family protein [Lachnospiraceae bacterium]|nr:nucleotidyl transferase AbiEii/AbiGii toxin family protein [Lachnospiraceae bacterium]
MKQRTPEQLKGQIRSFVAKRNLQPQEVLQMYMFERVLERISKSPYKENFILKGGFLIASMVGIEGRTTMDMDTTVRGIDMQEDVIRRIIMEILEMDIGDGIRFDYTKIEPIREEDDYNNFRVYFVAHYGKIATDMKMDITTGDIITPGAIDYSYKTILDNDEIAVKAYNRATIIAEKYETIIRRNLGTTRARDFYDLYMFYKLYQDILDPEILRTAVMGTSKKRGSETELAERMDICDEMSQDQALRVLWENYKKNSHYTVPPSFDDVIRVVKEIGQLLI